VSESGPDLRTALQRAATLGPFSAVDAEPGPGWAPASTLLDGAVLDARIASTLAALRGSSGPASPDDRRAAASVMLLGLAARLVAPAVATATLAGWVPDLAPARLWWQPGVGDPVPLALVEPTGVRADEPVELAAAVHELVIDRLLQPLVDGVERVASVSPLVLWGDVWSGLVGGLAPIARARRDLAGRASLLVAAVLAEEVARHGQSRQPGEFGSAGGYRRTTCCLLYRLPGGGLCGDCVLR
jgi:hypothetical protein